MILNPSSVGYSKEEIDSALSEINESLDAKVDEINESLESKASKDDVVGIMPSMTAITLAASGWDSTTLTQSATVTGILADETKQFITVAPASANMAAASEAGIYCSGQDANSLTFTCTTVPTEDVKMNIIWQDAEWVADPGVIPPSEEEEETAELIYIYEPGNEHEDITGGYSMLSNKGSMQKTSESITVACTDAEFCGVGTNNLISRNGAKSATIYVIGSYGVVRAGVSTQRTDNWPDWTNVVSTEAGQTGEFEIVFDENTPSEFYVCFGCGVGAGAYTFAVSEIKLNF